MSKENPKPNQRVAGSHDKHCDDILPGKTPVKKVCESENVLAYQRPEPYYEDHIIVIPKTHINDLTTLDDDDLLLEIMHVIQSVAKDLLQKKGTCRVFTNIGEYQNSKHLHWHVVSWPIDKESKV